MKYLYNIGVFLVLILGGCSEQKAQIGDPIDDFEQVYGEYTYNEEDGSLPYAYFSNGISVQFSKGQEDLIARRIIGVIQSRETIANGLEETKETYIPSQFDYRGPDCNNQNLSKLENKLTNNPSFYFIDENNLAIKVSFRTHEGEIMEDVTIEHVGTKNERSYNCEIEIDDSIDLGEM